ncbi:MAG: metalloprotease TldD [Rhodobacteraceae bacterium]|nr:metalloprotease TldD [Paracoccaceae bacterium]MDG1880462.1 metalloprotease TldD [Paracoccaceae bacterium]|tara:strand:+ start:2873 stop:4309 length:1437 start_codon:yes stop_codon:yes gene_type:complete
MTSLSNKNVAPFEPFKEYLDQDKALQILNGLTKGADDGEIYFERNITEALIFDNNNLKTASFNAAEGFGIRTVLGESTGYAHSTEISERALLRAANSAKIVSDIGGGKLAIAPRKTNLNQYEQIDPVSEATFGSKVNILKEINEYARSLDSRVFQVSISIAASHQEIEILRPEGFSVKDVRPMTRLNISIIVEKDGRRETGTAGGGGRSSVKPLLERSHWEKVAKEALRVGLVNLDAVPAPAGIMDIVLGPGWPGILLHEAIGHGLEGDFNRKGTSAFSNLMGKQIAAKGVTVLDDGTLKNRRGSITFDDEGTPSARNILIEDGKLVSYMQDRQNSRLMNVKSTGNGRRESYAHAPMPRMTNTFMLGGTDEPKSLLADLKNGIWATGFGGGQVDITNGKFVFSCTEAYLVKNGAIGAPIKGATLIGDGATALKQIRGLGNDMAMDPGMGNCGKQGQWVPVGVGQPSLLIGGLTIGGSA